MTFTIAGPTDEERRQRYAAALLGPDAAGTLDSAADEMLAAVMAVADAEQAQLRAEVDRLGDWVRAVTERAKTAETAHDRTHSELIVNEGDRVAAVNQTEAHRLALSEALDLGTGAPWDAIHERVQELHRLAAQAQQQEQPCPHCVCGDPVQLMDDNDPTSWIHSPGSDTPCLEARPRCPKCQMSHAMTPSMELACASIRASIRGHHGDEAQQQPDTETPCERCGHGKQAHNISGCTACPGGWRADHRFTSVDEPPADPWSMKYHQMGHAELNPAVCTCGLGPNALTHNEPPHAFNGRPKPGMPPVHGICTDCHHHETAACHTAKQPVPGPGRMADEETVCDHSFPDPHPEPVEEIGDCRHCGISYQEAKAQRLAASMADDGQPEIEHRDDCSACRHTGADRD